ncbi:1323_t:CDS:2, partial [Racocetra persica]
DKFLENDSTSFLSESLISENFGTENEIGFEKVYMMTDISENEELNWENIDIDIDKSNVTSIPVLEPESEELTEGTIYLIEDLQIDSHSELSQNNSVKLQCRQTTDNEKEILNVILNDESFSEIKALEILDQLTSQNKE